MQATCFRIL